MSSSIWPDFHSSTKLRARPLVAPAEVTPRRETVSIEQVETTMVRTEVFPAPHVEKAGGAGVQGHGWGRVVTRTPRP